MRLVIDLDPQDSDDVLTAIEGLFAYLPTRSYGEVRDMLDWAQPQAVTGEDVPPVPIEQAIAEAHAETAPVVAAAPASEVDAVRALRAFVAAQGVPAAHALLKEFGVARVGELSSEQRAEFVARTHDTTGTSERAA